MIQYIVDKDKKEVTAYILNTANQLIDTMAKRLRLKQVYTDKAELYRNIETLDSYHLKGLKMKDKYTVTVRCKEGDTFSEEVGKMYARVALLKKYNSDVDRKVAAWGRHLEEMEATCERTGYYPAIIDDVVVRSEGLF